MGLFTLISSPNYSVITQLNTYEGDNVLDRGQPVYKQMLSGSKIDL